jgi:hypothetical protein
VAVIITPPMAGGGDGAIDDEGEGEGEAVCEGVGVADTREGEGDAVTSEGEGEGDVGAQLITLGPATPGWYHGKR